MTRKDELKKRAVTIVDEFPLRFETTFERVKYYQYIFDMLLKFEQAVLARCQDKIESLMEKENESTDDQVWEYRDWLKEQQKGLG